MEILPGIEIVHLALYLKKQNSLVLGDIHIGYEEALNRRGVLIPRHHFQDVLAGLNYVFHLLGNRKLGKIIINGDLKHEFGSISSQEWREILKLFDLLSRHCGKVVLVKGNHDVILGPVARKRKLEIVDDYAVDGIFISHGHQIPDKDSFKKASAIIIGNEHPAVSIRDGPRSELFKCFLGGRFKGKKMIVMPSFNPVTVGTDVLKGKFISPFLNQNIDSFRVYVAADGTYYFGRVKGLK